METARLEVVLQQIAEQPAPVVFVDTCAILDIQRALYLSDKLPMDLPRAAAVLSDRASSSPRQIWLISSEVLLHEFRKNRQSVSAQLTDGIAKLMRQMRHTAGAGQILLPDHRLSIPQLPESELAVRALELMDGFAEAIVLVEKAPALINAANARGGAKNAPAGEAKPEFEDCLIFETYLRISKGTQGLGAGPCIFVTSNSKDFGPPPGKDNLPVEVEAVGGIYVGNLCEALGLLDGRTGREALAKAPS